MKLGRLIFCGLWLSCFSAWAQVSVDITLAQNEFLPGETLPAQVHITNRSGQTLHLGAETNWLTFDVESSDGFVVVKNADPPVLGAFDLGSSEVATKVVNLTPYFALTQPGHDTVTATVRIKQWNTEVVSPGQGFDLIHGAKLWSQVFGLPVPAGVSNRPPEVRQYMLEEANYLRRQLRLYACVSDASGERVFKVFPICNMVSFGQPEEQLDRLSNLHVLCQSGASVFTYVVINPDGDILEHDLYDYVRTRPRLGMDGHGDIVVIGGVRRTNPAALQAIQPSPPPAGPAEPRPATGSTGHVK
ncbi:MAG: hypothetical protein KGJ60_10475 [Verrucomicrobiota bacterium]|nr:hypothetical protein [Verrucomicrobiota bacterium]MDE3067960.1 hypothetical protein [Verrucomicrobiota bacterium]